MNPRPPLSLKPACMNLRHKLMYCDQRQAAPGMVDDQSDTRVFFCIKTHDPLGPDGQPVSTQDCVPSRKCYCASATPDQR